MAQATFLYTIHSLPVEQSDLVCSFSVQLATSLHYLFGFINDVIINEINHLAVIHIQYAGFLHLFWKIAGPHLRACGLRVRSLTAPVVIEHIIFNIIKSYEHITSYLVKYL